MAGTLRPAYDLPAAILSVRAAFLPFLFAASGIFTATNVLDQVALKHSIIMGSGLIFKGGVDSTKKVG